MARRIDIELTSTRTDGTWTWRAAGAREPRGTVESELLPEGAKVGDVVRAELQGFLDGIQVVDVLPPKSPRSEPERLELLAPRSEDAPTIRAEGPSPRRDRRPRQGDDGRKGRQARDPRQRKDRAATRSAPGEQDGPTKRSGQSRVAGRKAPDREQPPRPQKPKPRRLRPARVHRTALLESLPAEEQPIAEQLLQGGIPAVRQAIQKQNEDLRAQGKPEVSADSLLQIAERLRPGALAAAWRDRADAALAHVDEVDLRDLRSVVTAADDAGRDADARAAAEQLRDVLARRLEKDQAAWIAEIGENLNEERVVRALRLSSRPPKAGSPLPSDLSERLVAATAAALTSDTSGQRWATVLEALAYSPIRRRVVPDSLPKRLDPGLRSTIARWATRLPEIAHIFDITVEEAPQRQGTPRPRRDPSRRRQRGKDGQPADDRRKGGTDNDRTDDTKKVGAMAGDQPSPSR